MEAPTMQLLPNHQIVINRFVAACQADERVLAAFLGGSYARGAADEYSDLDLYVITTDEAYQDFVAGREAFTRRLGQLLFLEDFDLPDIVFYILSDDIEGELRFGCASHFQQLHNGPYEVLLDKQGLLAGVIFSESQLNQARQSEMLRRLIVWFWHDLSHFITAIGRRQLWWAYGQLEELRRYDMNLARLRQNFQDIAAGAEGHFKIDLALPVEQLSSLQATFCPLEEGAMLRAALLILRFYQELAPELARTHAVAYPAELERMMSDRLEKLCEACLS
jgi:predicted nucleotidyltransferase